jgi:hypothetical protein
MPGLNQIQFGAPQGGMPNVLKPVGDAVNNALGGIGQHRQNLQYLGAQHALSSMRDERKHGYNMELQTGQQKHEKSMLRTKNKFAGQMAQGQQAHEQRLQTSRQRHEIRGLNLTQGHEATQNANAQAHELNMGQQTHNNASAFSAQGHAQTLAELQAKFKGIGNMGKSGRVGEFSLGDMKAKYNPYQAPAAPTPSAPEAPQATSTPTPAAETKEAFVPKVIKGPGGKIMKNPDHPDNQEGAAPAQPRARKSAPKTTGPSVRRNPKTGKIESLKK